MIEIRPKTETDYPDNQDENESLTESVDDSLPFQFIRIEMKEKTQEPIKAIDENQTEPKTNVETSDELVVKTDLSTDQDKITLNNEDIISYTSSDTSRDGSRIQFEDEHADDDESNEEAETIEHKDLTNGRVKEATQVVEFNDKPEASSPRNTPIADEHSTSELNKSSHELKTNPDYNLSMFNKYLSYNKRNLNKKRKSKVSSPLLFSLKGFDLDSSSEDDDDLNSESKIKVFIALYKLFKSL